MEDGGWGMGSQSNGGWGEDSLAVVKCKGSGEGRDKSKNDSRGSVKLLKALSFPGRQFVLHTAESTSWETEYHLERAPRSWGGGGGWKSGPALTSFLEAWLERSKARMIAFWVCKDWHSSGFGVGLGRFRSMVGNHC